jgi:putative endonuclease
MTDTHGDSWRRSGEAERFVAQVLEGEGYSILATNYRAHGTGEIDIIARSGSTLAFVEVKLTAETSHSFPIAKIDSRKRERLAATASLFIASEDPSFESCRFDVALVRLRKPGSTDGELSLDLYLEDAFRPEGFFCL